jgi:hypothetical protein
VGSIPKPVAIGSALLLLVGIGTAAAWTSRGTSPGVRSIEEGNPLAPIGLDCSGGEAGTLDYFGVTQEFSTPEEAVSNELAGMADLSIEAKGASPRLVSDDAGTSGGIPAEREYVVEQDGRIVARVVVVERDGKWFVSGSVHCVSAPS